MMEDSMWTHIHGVREVGREDQEPAKAVVFDIT